MDNHQTRKLVIISVAVIILVGLAIALLSGGGGDKKEQATDGLPDGTTITTDKDTGDEIMTVPNKGEEFGFEDDIVVLGGESLLSKTNLTYTQYDLLIRLVNTYAKENVGKITTIKFLPDTIKAATESEPGDYYVQVKTVDPENILVVNINMLGTDKLQLLISNTNKPELGTFDTGIVPDQADDNHEDDGDDGPEVRL